MQKKSFSIVCIACFIGGAVLAGVWGYIRQLEQAARYNTERDRLEREYAAGQRELEIRNEYAQRTIDGAREIAERAGTHLQQSAGNLREAGAIIGAVYLQVKALEDWFNNRGTGGGGGRGADGLDAMGGEG